MAPKHRGSDRFASSKGVQHLNPEAAMYASDRYRISQETFDSFDVAYQSRLDCVMHNPLYRRQVLLNYGRRVYRLQRTVPEELLFEALARDAAERVCGLSSARHLAQAARVALDTIGVAATDIDVDGLAARIEEIQVLLGKSGGNMNEGQKPVDTPPQPTEEDKLASARAREEKVVVKVKLSELRNRVEQYLAERLHSKDAAELAAQGLVEAFEAKERAAKPRPEVPGEEPESGAGKGNGRGNGRHSRDWATEETAADKFRSRRAIAGLKLALAGHQPIVRLVVAERLQGQRPIDEIATKFDLTRDEVLDILGKMRFWVGRFTDSYRDDWYWTDSKQKYIIPEHKLAPKKKGLRLHRC